jgi:cell division protein FtsZ
MLADATNVLVQVAGGPGLTLSEVEVLMQELGRHVNEQTQLLFGAAVDGRLGDRLTVTIISSLAADEDLISESRNSRTSSSASAQPPVVEDYQHPEPQIHIEPEPAPMEAVPPDESISFEEPAAAEATAGPAFVSSEPEPLAVAPQKKAAPEKEEKGLAEKSLHAKQETLQFEPVTRGRFEKSEPTIVEGEDLDVPTYLRKNIKVK